MQTDNKLFDDFVKFVNGAAGTMAGMAREGGEQAKERAKEWIGGLDFVSRDEFEVTRALALAAREEADALKLRVAALEAQLGGAPAKAPKKPPAKA